MVFQQEAMVNLQNIRKKSKSHATYAENFFNLISSNFQMLDLVANQNIIPIPNCIILNLFRKLAK